MRLSKRGASEACLWLMVTKVCFLVSDNVFSKIFKNCLDEPYLLIHFLNICRSCLTNIEILT